MAPQARRKIDELQEVTKRPKEMQVLVLCFSRTGTRSMWTALQMLGYTPYHGGEMFQPHLKSHMRCWQEGLATKSTTGNSYGRTEFDKLFADYDAVTDCPCANFSQELITAYPDAKVILTVRNPDKWVRSMEESYYKMLDLVPWWNPLLYYDPDIWSSFRKFLHQILSGLTSNDIHNHDALRRGFIAHNDHVRSLVPANELLIYQAGDGWEPLCRHLGKEVPEEPYPRVNEGSYAANGIRFLVVRALWEMCALPVKALAGIGVAWVVWWVFSLRR